jgi:putative MATE family efflux protein
MNYLAGGILRSAGNMKVPSLLNVGMCVLDVIFNWFLIFPTRDINIGGTDITMPGAGMGVAGAALGTVAAEIITACIMMWYMLCVQPEMKLRGRQIGSFRPSKTVLRRAVKISAPMTLEHAIFCGAQVMITIIVAPIGVVAIAANSFAVTAESLCYMPGFGIGEAATTLVGQSYGAGRRDLVVRFCHLNVALGVAVMSLMGTILYFCAPFMMGIMTDVGEICQLGTEVLRIEAWAEPLYAASIVAYGAFVGVGDTMLPAVMNFGSIWVVRIPLAAILAPTMGLRGVWIAMAVELSFRGGIFLWRMFSNSWLHSYKEKPMAA